MRLDQIANALQKAFHEMIIDYRDGKDPTWDWDHLEHCAHFLRQEIMCDANDDLIYTGKLHGQENVDVPVVGVNQYRMCRDWSQLVDWVTERSACYHHIPSTGPGFQESERYKFCPGDVRPWEDDEVFADS